MGTCHLVGNPRRNWKMLKTFYLNLTSVFKLNGHVGKPWLRTHSLAQGCSFSMMLVTLPVTAWAKAVLYTLHPNVASISAYVDDKVMRSSSWRHIENLLERIIHFDRVSGQFLNFQKSTGLSNTKGGMKTLRTLSVEGSPLPIVKDAKSPGALVTTAMLPSNFIQEKRIERFILSVKGL